MAQYPNYGDPNQIYQQNQQHPYVINTQNQQMNRPVNTN